VDGDSTSSRFTYGRRRLETWVAVICGSDALPLQETDIMQVILGAVVGIVVAWLYQSERVREEAQRRLATAPESWRQAATSAKGASAGQIERVAQAVDAAPVPQPMKETLGRATTAARSTAEKLGGPREERESAC
jgi:hypothetical protein